RAPKLSKSARRAEKKGAPSRPGAKRVEGVFGRGLWLDGRTSVAMSGLAGPKTAFSVALWIKPLAMGKRGPTIDAGRGFSERKKGGQFCLIVVRGGSVHCGTDDATRFTPDELGLGTVELGKWQHLTYTHDGTTGRFYKNGRLLGTKNQAPPKPWLYLSLSSIHGAIDDLRVYGRALETGEVRNLLRRR
ncbi:MAG: LamG domain-containing protein, partial [Planctomycetota bacterium]